MQTIENVGQAQPAPRPPSMDPDSLPLERAARPPQADRQQPAEDVAKSRTTAHKPVSYGAGF